MGQSSSHNPKGHHSRTAITTSTTTTTTIADTNPSNMNTSHSNSSNCNNPVFAFHRSGGRPPVMIPTEPVDILPTPLPREVPRARTSSPSSSSSSSTWLSTAEAKLTREWIDARLRQERGVVATSPHVPLTCPAVAFPANRTTMILHPNVDDDVPVTELPVGEDFFLALRAAWRTKSELCGVLPQTDEGELDDSFIQGAIEDTVGSVLTPPVPLSYMVSDILIPQWEMGGLYDAPALRGRP